MSLVCIHAAAAVCSPPSELNRRWVIGARASRKGVVRAAVERVHAAFCSPLHARGHLLSLAVVGVPPRCVCRSSSSREEAWQIRTSCHGETPRRPCGLEAKDGNHTNTHNHRQSSAAVRLQQGETTCVEIWRLQLTGIKFLGRSLLLSKAVSAHAQSKDEKRVTSQSTMSNNSIVCMY